MISDLAPQAFLSSFAIIITIVGSAALATRSRRSRVALTLVLIAMALPAFARAPHALIDLCPFDGLRCSLTGSAKVPLAIVVIATIITAALLRIPPRIAQRRYLLAAACLLVGLAIFFATSIAIA